MCQAIPGKVAEMVDEVNSIAKVEFSGVKRKISLALLQDEGVRVDDWVLIHVGFAISKIDEKEALDTYQFLLDQRILGRMS